MDISLVKVRVEKTMIGADVFLPLNVNGGTMRDIDYGATCNADVKIIQGKRQRSHEQLSLYWVGCRFIADQTDNLHFNTQRKVDQQCKLHCHLVEDEIKYRVPATGEVRVHLVLGSVSYAKLKHLEACGYFSEAFDYQTEIYNLMQRKNNPYHQDITKDEYTELLKEFIANNYQLAVGL